LAGSSPDFDLFSSTSLHILNGKLFVS
jgi:hypothetical protein